MKNKFQTIIFAMTAILSLPVVSETIVVVVVSVTHVHGDVTGGMVLWCGVV